MAYLRVGKSRWFMGSFKWLQHLLTGEAVNPTERVKTMIFKRRAGSRLHTLWLERLVFTSYKNWPDDYKSSNALC